MTSRIFPVSTINAYIHDVVTSDELLADVWIEGEVTRVSTPRSGHVYFTLGEGEASLDAVMWRSAVARQRFIPRAGEAVVIHGRADFYEAQGRLQILADVFEHQGQGLMSLEFERLRQQLEAEGLFDELRKRPLPAFPRRIGVVTSSSGAVWHDIQTVSRRRFPLVELVLIPASVQGDRAPVEIANAIQYANSVDGLDLLIVGRGGGSPEDLACFNAEVVARAVFASRLPVISAVGHETDTSICDLVADLRAPTPSAAAELALPDAAALQETLEQARSGLSALMHDELEYLDQQVLGLKRRLQFQSPESSISRQRAELAFQLGMVSNAMARAVHSYSQKLERHADLLFALHPQEVLRRGYAIIQDAATGKPVASTVDLPESGEVVAHFNDGIAKGILRASPEGTTSK